MLINILQLQLYVNESKDNIEDTISFLEVSDMVFMFLSIFFAIE